jgi:tRNA/tmRNA/rRNA uracil-C5-methylase (TrmA/RlmC/RlmD family)
MNVHDTLILTIIDIAFGGDGVGRMPDGRVVFVPFTAIGDRIKAKVTAVQPRMAKAVLEEIIEPGQHRVAPVCPLYGQCGGCRYQHIDAAVQIGLKQAQLSAALRRLGGLRELPAVEKAVASPLPYGYRNKFKLQAFRPIKGGAAAYGFCALDNKTMLEVSSCPLASAAVNAAAQEALASPDAARNAGRDEPLDLTVRSTASGHSYWYFGLPPKTMAWATEELLGKPVQVPPGGFWQINSSVSSLLVQEVADWFKASPTPQFIDAYAGVGPFCLAVGASAAGHVLIEMDREAIEGADRNTAAWGIKGVEILPGAAETRLPSLLRQLGPQARESTVLLDPPRTGADPRLLTALRGSAVAQAIYVSCNPATLARDLKQLCGEGETPPFRVIRLAAFDMFPQTPHLESVVLLQR